MRLLSDVTTERRYPIAPTEAQARALEVCARYFLGTEDMGDGDSEAVKSVREAIEIVAGVRVEAERLRARRAWVRDMFSRAFRAILGVHPRWPSRDVRPMALADALREVFR